MNNDTCHGCSDRTLTCHDTCERYKAWKENRRRAVFAYNEQMKASRDADFRMSRASVISPRPRKSK